MGVRAEHHATHPVGREKAVVDAVGEGVFEKGSPKYS